MTVSTCIFLQREQANINIDHPDQSFSGVDVDKVDLTKYPGLGQVPWYNVTMERGDCLFIPYRWFHAVRSWGRNLAVNVWFIHRLWFNETDCSDELMVLPEYVPLSSFKTRASHLEILRSEIANGIEVYGGLITVEEMYDLIQRSTKQQITQLFQSLDQNGDKKLSMKEAYSESFAEACKSADISFDKEKDDEEEVEEGDEEEEEDDIGGEVENDEAHRSTGREEEHEEL
eukprot:XP_003723742.1 PREDICTED: uncharacterized protein LOC100892633 [Strongylocentrotus purpuratus]